MATQRADAAHYDRARTEAGGQDYTTPFDRDTKAARDEALKLRNAVLEQLKTDIAAGNVELPMTFAGVERPERRRRVSRALESVGLGERVGHRPEQLSGGEQQRVAIARAIAMDPAILLADEPTGNLDSASGEALLDVFREMNQAEGQTIVMITHSAHAASRADRILHMRDGQILEADAEK